MDRNTTRRLPKQGLVRKLLAGTRGLTIAGAVALGLVGCTPLHEYIENGFKVGPNYGKPPVPVANQWIDTPNPRLRPDTDELSNWWTVFQDPILDSLTCTASKQNLSLAEAGFRILQARAEMGIAVSTLFPQTQAAEGGYQRKGVSVKVANRVATPQRWFDNWGYGFKLGWELDFWGKFRRNVESYEARLDAKVEDYDAVLVTLLGDVASNYTQLRVSQKRLEYVRKNVELQELTLGIAISRFKNGLTSGLDTAQAESTLAQTRALVPQEEIKIRQAANRLCILLGMPPSDLQKKLGTGDIPNAPASAGVGIPCQVLLNRPDVRAAEREAAAACAKIGVAEADLYPAVSILGTIGYAAQDLSKIFNAEAFYGSIGPSFQWNILLYGKLVSHIALEKARFQEKAVAFQNTVLKANEEAENSIITYLKSHERVAELQKSVKAYQDAVAIAVAQYRAGTVDFNRVSVLEQNLVTQQDNLAVAQGDIALGLVGIYRALGGGWEIRLHDCDGTPPVAGALPPLPSKPEKLPDPKKKNDKDKEEELPEPKKGSTKDKDTSQRKDSMVKPAAFRMDALPVPQGEPLPDVGQIPAVRTTGFHP